MSVRSDIANDKTWAWARGTKDVDLKRRMDTLRMGLSDWGSKFMIQKNFADLRKGFTSERLMNELDNVVALKEKVADVEAFCDGLMEAKMRMPR